MAIQLSRKPEASFEEMMTSSRSSNSKNTNCQKRLLQPGKLLQPSQPLCHGSKVFSPVLLHQLCLLLQSQSFHLEGRSPQGLLWLLFTCTSLLWVPNTISRSASLLPTSFRHLPVFISHCLNVLSHLLRSPVVNSTTSCKLAMSDLYLGGFKT